MQSIKPEKPDRQPYHFPYHRINKYRAIAKISQEELADRAEIQRTTVSITESAAIPAVNVDTI